MITTVLVVLLVIMFESSTCHTKTRILFFPVCKHRLFRNIQTEIVLQFKPLSCNKYTCKFTHIPTPILLQTE